MYPFWTWGFHCCCLEFRDLFCGLQPLICAQALASLIYNDHVLIIHEKTFQKHLVLSLNMLDLMEIHENITAIGDKASLGGLVLEAYRVERCRVTKGLTVILNLYG